MKTKSKVLLCILLSFWFITTLKAQDSTNSKDLNRNILDRLIRLEEGQKNLDKRIDDLRSDMNNRFQDMIAKFSWLFILLSAIIALNAAMVGSVIWLARQDRPIGQRHYDEIIDREIKFERKLITLSNDVERIKSELSISE
ncbi:hypothetical protein H8E88_28875 [candidate division KSB1 bacterium]|nr:hypothetical protein [candidate division KSB1 bacterium]